MGGQRTDRKLRKLNFKSKDSATPTSSYSCKAKPFYERTMKKSELLRALQFEIQKHNLSTFMDEKDKIVITGCTLCRKHFGTVEQFKRHITDDVLPPLLDTLSSEKDR